MPSSVSVAHRIAQLVVATSLIAALIFAVLVASPSPAPAAIAHGIQDISTVAHTWSATFGVNSLADGPQILCGSASGACP